MKKQKSGNEEILKDLFTRMEVVEPSEGFTDRIMSRVAVKKVPLAETSRPLISRTMWIILGVLFAGPIVFVIISGQGVPAYISQYINLNYSFNFNFDITDRFVQFFNSSITISTPTVSYIVLGIILASLLFMVDRLISNIRSLTRS